MWTALGTCYEKLGKKAEALKCQQRATRSKDREGIALFKMAQLHRSLGDRDRSAQCFKLILQKQANRGNTIECQHAHLFLG